MNAKRFWAKVDKTKDCWEWTASKDGKGYGHFGVKGKMVVSHRVSWMLANGDIPENGCILHKCDNPLCVRPDHLFLGSQQDNMLDMSQKGRRSKGQKHSETQRGENNGRSKITESDVLDARAKYLAGGYTQQDLAKAYGMSQVNMGRVLNRVTRRHL